MTTLRKIMAALGCVFLHFAGCNAAAAAANGAMHSVPAAVYTVMAGVMLFPALIHYCNTGRI